MHAQKMEAMGVLAAGVAHDFNNILQVLSLRLYIQLLTRDAALEGSQRDYLAHIGLVSAVYRAAELALNLLKINPIPSRWSR